MSLSIVLALASGVYCTKLVEDAVSYTKTVAVFVSISVSGITNTCLSLVSPTRNVLVFSVPSKIGISFEPSFV